MAATGAEPRKEGCSRHCWPTSICTGLIESSKVKSGPAHWAKATLIQYADDFVVMARHMGPKIRDFIEQKLEAWLGLKLNREKTRIVNLRRKQERLEFLGYQIGLAPVRDDRRRHYWRMEPSHKAMEREVDRIWQMTSHRQMETAPRANR